MTTAVASKPVLPDRSQFELVTCCLCGEAAQADFLTAEDDLTGRPGRFSFVQCRGCGLVYQSPRLTIEHIKSFYEDGYIAHRKTNWGPLSPLFNRAMQSLDRRKLAMVSGYVPLDRAASVLDVGCGAGSFLAMTKSRAGATVAGVDFMDLSDRPDLQGVEFHCGPFYEQDVGVDRFDLITMWHFLEHDYEPMRSLEHARTALAPDGRLVIEVPRLDSVTFRWFKSRWPGVQAPQHTVLFDRARLVRAVEQAGFEVVDYLPYGAFPPYFYLFCGVAFQLRRGRGLNLQKAIYAYFAGQLVLLPVLPLLQHLNFAMQTVVCRRAR